MDNKKTRDDLTREAIIRVIAFFDLFDYPLTLAEIYQWAPAVCEGIKIDFEDIRLLMESGGVDDVISRRRNFYFLRGREEIVKTRISRYNFTDRKIKKALMIANIFRAIPWIKMIAVANLIGSHNLKEGGDIDIFIITEKGRVWVSRFFCVAITKLLGLRPSKGNTRDKICLSFFVSEDRLNFESLMIWDDGVFDVYFIYWLAGLMPIYDPDRMYRKFIRENYWIKKYLPNIRFYEGIGLRGVKSGGLWASTIGFSLDKLFGRLDDLLRRVQLEIMPEEVKHMANNDSRVILNRSTIKMHVNDRRMEYWRKFEDKIDSLLVTHNR